ncbi:PKD domain-containing protein, partial [Thermoplasmatales archaeon AK]|nr:PKD domain-containing protein [Thermoplasmatales archaeon AK]
GQHETGASISHVFSSSGPDTFEVQVSDQGGYTETRNFTVDVGLYVAVAANQTSGLGPLPVQFSSSVLGGSGYSFNWTFSPGHYSLEQNPSYTFPVGNYTVRFLVKSANGATGSANISIQSLPPPVSFQYSTDLNITQAFHFDAIPNWDAKGPYNMSWSFPNGQTITGMNISYRFPVYDELNTVIATFSYGDGKTWTQYLTVRMIPAVPVVAFNPPSIIPTGTMLSLNASATSPDSSSFSYSWDINGTSESGQSVLYYFQNPGNYSISVTVTDSLGASAVVYRTIEVLPQGTNSSIAISYTRDANGPMDYYTVKVLSTSGIIAVEAFLGTTPLNISEINSTYTASGELAYFNLSMDQRDYPAGTYGISIVAFNNNSQSNHISIPFSVTSQYSSTFSLADIIAFFGGFSNFLIIILTVGGLVIAYASLRREDNPDVIVEGTSPRGRPEKVVLKGRK